MDFELFTGWKLNEAREALAIEQSTRALPIQLLETAAPVRKNSNQTFGDWRVLRARLTENHTIELTVARELLTEERRAS